MYKKRLYGYIIERSYMRSFKDEDGVIYEEERWMPHWNNKVYSVKFYANKTVQDMLRQQPERKFRLKPLYEFIEEK